MKKQKDLNEYEIRLTIESLRGLQYAAQATTRSLAGKQYLNSVKAGVWFNVVCICGHDFRTPFNIPDNAVCPECGFVFFADRIKVKKVRK